MSDFLNFIVVEHIRFFHGAIQFCVLARIRTWAGTADQASEHVLNLAVAHTYRYAK